MQMVWINLAIPNSKVGPHLENPASATGYVYVMGLNFEITFVSEKHVVEDDVLFTNQGIPTEVIPCGEDMAQAGCD